MARVAATDITVTILDKGMVGKKRRIYGSLTFNATSLTYTVTTGIPLPAYGYFGFLKQCDNVFFNAQVDGVGDGLVFKYDKTTHVAATGGLRVFRSAAATPSGSVSAPTFTGVAATPTGSVSAPTFTGDAMTTWGTPTGSVSAPAFTGVAATPTGSVSAPAFTGVAIAAAGLAEFTDNIALGGVIVLYWDAIGV